LICAKSDKEKLCKILLFEETDIEKLQEQASKGMIKPHGIIRLKVVMKCSELTPIKK